MLRYADYDIVFQEIPDEVTLAINLSNCPNHCKGCHSAYLMEDIGEPLTEESLSTLLGKYGKAITCVCFMGGDASPAEVEQLAAFLHKQTITPVKVGWYSGKSKLPEHFDVSHFQYIKLGPYIESLVGLKSETTNQRLYHIENGIIEDITYRFLPHHSKKISNGVCYIYRLSVLFSNYFFSFVFMISVPASICLILLSTAVADTQY